MPQVMITNNCEVPIVKTFFCRVEKSDPKDFYAVCAAVALQVVRAVFHKEVTDLLEKQTFASETEHVNDEESKQPVVSKAPATYQEEMKKILHMIFSKKIAGAFVAAPGATDAITVPKVFVGTFLILVNSHISL